MSQRNPFSGGHEPPAPELNDDRADHPPIWQDDRAEPPPIWQDQQPPKAYLRQQPQPPGRGRSTSAIVAVLMAALLVAAGAAAAAVDVRGHGGTVGARARHTGGGQGPASPASPQVTQTQPGAPGTPGTTGTLSPPSPQPPGASVAVAPWVAGNPAAPPVVGFLRSYFGAINVHDYQAFRSLLDPRMRQVETRQRFSTGFRSTRDFGATLIGLAVAAAGRRAATVAFTSRQSPADSLDHSACTRWIITLYLEHSRGSYVLGLPPAGDRPAHQPC